jgi:DNA-binding MarR family transcriptional regulator
MSDEPAGPGLKLGELSEDISFLTRTIRARMRPEIGALRQEFDVAPGEIGVLRIVGLNPGISQNDLAAAVVIKKSAVTKVVRDLMERGLLRRERVHHDRRYNALSLTPSGETLVGTLAQRVHDLYDDWFAGFSPEERTQLYRLLEKLADALADRAVDPAPTDDE